MNRGSRAGPPENAAPPLTAISEGALEQLGELPGDQGSTATRSRSWSTLVGLCSVSCDPCDGRRRLAWTALVAELRAHRPGLAAALEAAGADLVDLGPGHVVLVLDAGAGQDLVALRAELAHVLADVASDQVEVALISGRRRP